MERRLQTPMNRRFNLLVIFAILALVVPRLSRAEDGGADADGDKDDDPEEGIQNDDFTKLKAPPGGSQWAFGPTDFYGWTVNGVKQIYVKAVDEGSPAAGVLQPGDVVLGIVSHKGTPDSGAGSNNLFSNNDVRPEIAAAITEAEKTENGGRLVGDDPELTESLIVGMHQRAHLMAGPLASCIDIEGRRLLVDVGGGPGALSFMQELGLVDVNTQLLPPPISHTVVSGLRRTEPSREGQLVLIS